MTRSAGKTQYPCGTKIRIIEMTEKDSWLNGATGELTHPFGFLGCYDYGAVAGVYLDDLSCQNRDLAIGYQCHVMNGDFELLE